MLMLFVKIKLYLIDFFWVKSWVNWLRYNKLRSTFAAVS